MGESFQGLGVSSGVAVGHAVLHEPAALPVVPVPVPPERVDEEIERFEGCRNQARAEIEGLRDRTLAILGERYAGMLDAQLLILDDPTLVSKTVQRIRVGRVSARWALKEVVADFIRRFDAVDDLYLRERGGDLDDVHRRLQRILGGGHVAAGHALEGPTVLVAHALGPSDAVALSTGNVVGLVTDVGGRTSHTAILAQALSLPAVVGLHDISERVRPGDPIIVDGDRGEILWLPEPAEMDAARERREGWLAREREMAVVQARPAKTRDAVEIDLRANIEFPEQVDRARRLGAEGIGLYRSEFLFLSLAPNLPTEEEHYRSYRALAEKVAPHPAFIRTLDLGGEKYFHEVLDRDESHPVLGLRGIRLCLRRPDIFRPQLRGLLRAAVHGDIRIMLPLVTAVVEIREVRRLLAEETESLRGEGIDCRGDVPVGIMVEVPAAAATADLLAREADFFSIGTNDLVQYALAADRDNESVSYLAQPLHPAVLRLIRFVVESAREKGVSVALCGEMAADPAVTSLLIGLGLRELSVQPRAMPQVRSAIRSVDAKDASRLASEALDCATAEEVEELLEAAACGEGERP
jgi:phosphotransferase system enzyme I (PtsI)